MNHPAAPFRGAMSRMATRMVVLLGLEDCVIAQLSHLTRCLWLPVVGNVQGQGNKSRTECKKRTVTTQ